ncbi:MAG: lipopolysaccharide biosynthesis protein [Bacteroidia bacterium]
MQLSRQILRNVFWNLFGYSAGIIFLVLSPYLYARWLGKDMYGVLMTLLWLPMQAQLFFWGNEVVLTQRVAISGLEAAREAARALWGWAWLAGAILSFIWAGVSPYVFMAFWTMSAEAVQTIHIALYWIGGIFPFQMTAVLATQILIGLGHFKQAAFLGFMQLIFTAGFPLLWVGLGEKGLSSAAQGIWLGYFLYAVVGNIWLVRWVGAPKLSWRENLSLWHLGVWQGGSNALGIFSQLYERFWIGRKISFDALGGYTAIFFVFTKSWMFLLKISEVLWSAFGKMALRGKEVQLLRLAQAMGVLGLFSSVVFLPWIFLAPGILSMWLGGGVSFPEKVAACAIALQLGFLGYVLPAFFYLQSQGAFRALFYRNLFLTVWIFSFSPFFLGLGGMHIGPLSGWGLSNILLYYFIVRETSERFFRKLMMEWVGMPLAGVSLGLIVGAVCMWLGGMDRWASMGVLYGTCGLGGIGGWFWGYGAGQRRSFARQLIEVFRGLAQTHLRP